MRLVLTTALCCSDGVRFGDMLWDAWLRVCDLSGQGAVGTLFHFWNGTSYPKSAYTRVINNILAPWREGPAAPLSTLSELEASTLTRNHALML